MNKTRGREKREAPCMINKPNQQKKRNKRNGE